jgi:hypothetical protein
MPKSFTPSAQQLDEGVVHICYEYSNLMSAAYWDVNGRAPWRTHADDAFLLGCRKMADFFLRTTRSKLRNGDELPDILALDYIVPNSKRKWTLDIWSKQWRGPMDKQLAHLSYVRNKSWDHRLWVTKLENEFRTVWRKFRRELDPRYKGIFTKELAKCRRKPGFATIKL